MICQMKTRDLSTSDAPASPCMDLGMYEVLSADRKALACGRHLRMTVDAQDSKTVTVVKL